MVTFVDPAAEDLEEWSARGLEQVVQHPPRLVLRPAAARAATPSADGHRLGVHHVEQSTADLFDTAIIRALCVGARSKKCPEKIVVRVTEWVLERMATSRSSRAKSRSVGCRWYQRPWRDSFSHMNWCSSWHTSTENLRYKTRFHT